MIVRYLRVSTINQNLLRQEYLLDKMGLKFDRSYEDFMTGKNSNRPELQKMISDVNAGDIVYCESITRLGRNLKDLIEIVETLTAKGVQVILVKEGIDTNSSTYKLLLGIFGAVAEMEREQIQERTLQSIQALKKAKEETGEVLTRSGLWFGNQPLTYAELPKDFFKYIERWNKKGGKLTATEISKILKIGRTTFYRYVKIYNEYNTSKE